jgi:putative ABC transport system substrate-binding protein
MVSESWGGRKVATSRSTLAGQYPPTWSRCSDSQRNSSRCSPTSFLSHITPTTAALLQQTRTIPIVFATVADPVGSGFVASFSRPGGNATGFTSIEPTMAGKWLELLKEIAPRVARVALLFNPVTAPYAEYFLNPLKAAALSFGVEAIAAPVRDTSELESVVTRIAALS